MTPDRWLVLSVRVPSAGLAEELGEVLIALGGAAVEEDGDLLTTYVPEPREAEAFLRDARDRLRAAARGQEPELLWRWQANRDWARRWRRGLRPRRVGPRLVVAPSWAEPAARPGDVVVVVDPKMAFGTGEHASTRGALRLLQEGIRPGDRVLDVGTGSAILAVAAAKLGAREVLAVESDAEALENARENVEGNEVADRVELLHGLVDQPFLAMLGPGRFDLIVANVLSGVLRPLLRAFWASLVPGGRLILAGFLDDESDATIEGAAEVGLVLLVEDLEEDWWAGLFERRGAPD